LPTFRQEVSNCELHPNTNYLFSSELTSPHVLVGPIPFKSVDGM